MFVERSDCLRKSNECAIANGLRCEVWFFDRLETDISILAGDQCPIYVCSYFKYFLNYLSFIILVPSLSLLSRMIS